MRLGKFHILEESKGGIFIQVLSAQVVIERCDVIAIWLCVTTKLCKTLLSVASEMCGNLWAGE